MVPLMTSFLRLSQHQAHGTSLFAVAATGIAGALGYSGQVQLDAAVSIAICGMVTARMGAAATSRLSEAALKRALGIFMVCVAPLVPARKYLLDKTESNGKGLQTMTKTATKDILNEKHEKQQQQQQQQQQQSTKNGLNVLENTEMNADYSYYHQLIQRYAVPSAIGLGSGFLAGLFGVGGGAVVVPALTIATDMNHYQALGTSLCAMALPAMVGTATHYSRGNVAMKVAPTLAVASFIGAYVGGKIGQRMNEDMLRWGFSGLMVTLGVRNLFKF